MAQIEGRPTVRLDVVIRLTEQEAGALNALFSYDIEGFLKVFYVAMGKAYLSPYEEGIRSLHASMGGMLSQTLYKAKEARKVFEQ